MLDLEPYMIQLVAGLKQEFGSRLIYIGLQGSYSRGEATLNSDLDIMTVLDQLQLADMDN